MVKSASGRQSLSLHRLSILRPFLFTYQKKKKKKSFCCPVTLFIALALIKHTPPPKKKKIAGEHVCPAQREMLRATNQRQNTAAHIYRVAYQNKTSAVQFARVGKDLVFIWKHKKKTKKNTATVGGARTTGTKHNTHSKHTSAHKIRFKGTTCFGSERQSREGGVGHGVTENKAGRARSTRRRRGRGRERARELNSRGSGLN